MKTYIERRSVEAEPMTWGEYRLPNALPGETLHFADEKGYRVKYACGVTVWISKKEFELEHVQSDVPVDAIIRDLNAWQQAYASAEAAFHDTRGDNKCVLDHIAAARRSILKE